MLAYLAGLSPVKTALWCYLIWYLNVLSLYFDPSPQTWITALGIAAIVGTANNLNALSGRQNGQGFDPWMGLRFFLAPFCVASFAAMVKGRGFILVFPPTLAENLRGLIGCLLFVALALAARRFHPAES
ncbi:hypothetical protein [Acanthopleuribacter pedis]|uniref:Uncharacterized protein n=1 Tax=Acanthopleuribacter pedis TaxID=442870 RepID=A0A8J7U494_9BACT|nr:hypothetical protein [Acanthopleuribacter pedis]MBO1319574.1 hypothetical protein [Acanthopleuribacter pedis]